MKVRISDTIEVIHTSEDSGASKLKRCLSPYRRCASTWLPKYETPDATIIITRIDEQPDQELHLHGRLGDRQHDEADQRHAGHAVGLEAVGRRADRVARVVAGAVGDHAGVARVVFLDAELDLHQVGADVGDLGEDAAGDAQRGGAQRLADGEADEALAGECGRHEQHDAEHDQSSVEISSMPMEIPDLIGIA